MSNKREHVHLLSKTLFVSFLRLSVIGYNCTQNSASSARVKRSSVTKAAAACYNSRMSKGLVAKAETSIDAPIEKVWEALTSPTIIKQYMFGAEVDSNWQVGSSIVWRGERQGKPYEDKGEILEMEENRVLSYSHYSPTMGKSDTPEHYHTVTVELSADGDKTKVSLSQDNNETEETREHSEKNWRTMLGDLKKLLEE